MLYIDCICAKKIYSTYIYNYTKTMLVRNKNNKQHLRKKSSKKTIPSDHKLQQPSIHSPPGKPYPDAPMGRVFFTRGHFPR